MHITMRQFHAVFTFTIVYYVGIIVGLEEPTCLSRFDYDYKLLTKMVDLEAKQKNVEERSTEKYQLLTDKIDETVKQLKHYAQSQQQMADQLSGMFFF